MNSSISVCNLTLTCSAEDLQSTVLRWFFNNEQFAQYAITPTHSYPFTVMSENASLSALAGVDIQVRSVDLDDENPDLATFISTLTIMNILALQEVGISATINCGTFGIRSNNFSLAMQNGNYIAIYK